jgi:ABC-type multidrug transport system fused ATPase/permease subunit
VSKGLSTPGTIVYIISTGTVTLQGLWQLVHEYTEILRRLIAVFRMKELLDEEPEIKDEPSALIPEKYIGNFALDNLAFAYPNKEKAVLENFNLNIEPGEMIAFVGKSGEGKTTAAKLICRMFDPTSGAILLDGQNVKEIKLDWYRRLFAVVQQDVDIFDASILENIRYSYPSALEEEVLEAMKASYLRVVLDDKERFPRGMLEQVGEKGVKLSGGERQRVGIARAYLALLNGAKVLVLDEATSSLDSQAELAIQKMIQKLREKQGISIIAIAHRLSTIQKADTIYVINNGKIIEKGNHGKLLERNGLYAELVNLQRMGELRK